MCLRTIKRLSLTALLVAGAASGQNENPFSNDGGNANGGGNGLFGNGNQAAPKNDPFAGENPTEINAFGNGTTAPKNEKGKNKKKPKKGPKTGGNPGPFNNTAPLANLPENPIDDTPVNPVPINGAPKNSAALNGAPANGAVVNGVPKNGTALNGAPKNTAPGEPAAPEEPPFAPFRPRPVLPRSLQPYSRIGEEALRATTEKPHYGIMGLAWGKTPADARAILAPKLKFVEEIAAPEEGYNTIDQRYEGDFAGLRTADIFLRFYKGRFFYMMITLATTEPGSAVRVFQDVRAKMREAYGPGRGYRAPIKLASQKAIIQNLELNEQEAKNGLPMLWNAQKEQNPAATNRMIDHYVRAHIWDPFEGWRFPNDVVIQTFVFEQFYKDRTGSTLKPLWIFCKKDVFDRWKKEIVAATIVEPRDF